MIPVYEPQENSKHYMVGKYLGNISVETQNLFKRDFQFFCTEP